MKQSTTHNSPALLPAEIKVVAYIRSSGANQEGSIEQQEKAIADYCEKHELVIPQIYTDN